MEPQPIEIIPQRLEPSVSLADGSLHCAPLSTIILATCDALYDDLHTLTNATIPVHTKSTNAVTGTTGDAAVSDAVNAAGGVGNGEEKEEREARMSNLSYAQRRHELTMRLSRHIRAVSHVTALIAGYCEKYANIEGPLEQGIQRSVTGAGLLGECVRVADHALQHVFEAWSMADEAQDALYFSHGALWNARKQCHDVHGAMDMYLSGSWRGIPSDVELAVDPYEKSIESTYTKDEVMKRLQACVRKKLLLGEIGYMKQRGCMDKFPWENIVLEQNGGTIKLTYGGKFGGKLKTYHLRREEAKSKDEPKKHPRVYPIEARLTVMDESSDAQWMLLSLDIFCSSKTGESIHQLETNNRQKMNLHKLCARAMALEEEGIKTKLKTKSDEKSDDNNVANNNNLKSTFKGDLIARPLECLFDVAHSFLNSISLEILWAQTGALRRGAWGNDQDGISITSLQYFGKLEDRSETLGGLFGDATADMSIHFWLVDDRFGKPAVSDLILSRAKKPGSREEKPIRTSKTENSQRLCLNIRSIPRKGLAVALSGGDDVIQAIHETPSGKNLLKAQYEKLLSSVNNPFELSAADAILAASVICAHMRSTAVVEALRGSFDSGKGLPDWLSLNVDCGSVSINTRISSVDVNTSSENLPNDLPIVEMYRLACDSRTGRFITVFPEGTKLLRLLAANDISVSGLQHMHKIKTVKKRKGANANRSVTGRLIKDAFDGLNRSMDVLGRKVGVGSHWDDLDTVSPSLRKLEIERSCVDVCAALMVCSGIAVTYGAAAIALSFTSGIEPVVDITGGVLEGESFLGIPPLGILLSQELLEKDKLVNKATPVSLKSDLLGVTAKVTRENLTMAAFRISTRMDSPFAVPIRLTCEPVPLSQLRIMSETSFDIPSSKRQRLVKNDGISKYRVCNVTAIAGALATSFQVALDKMNGEQVTVESAI